MVHYSGVFVVDFEQVNIGCYLWKTRIPENPGKVTLLFRRLSTIRKFFNRDHWNVPKLKHLVTQTKHNKNLIFHIADIALRLTVKTSFFKFTQINPFHIALFCAYGWSEGMWVWSNILNVCPFLEKSEFWHTYSHQNLCKFLKVKIQFIHILII